MSELTAEERHELVGILGKVNAAEIELREFHSKDALQRHELHKATEHLKAARDQIDTVLHPDRK